MEIVSSEIVYREIASTLPQALPQDVAFALPDEGPGRGPEQLAVVDDQGGGGGGVLGALVVRRRLLQPQRERIGPQRELGFGPEQLEGHPDEARRG